MKSGELREKSDGDLRDELHALLREQFNLRMQKGFGQMGNTSRLRTVRRDIARAKTVMNERRK
ncbi:MAG: 50S ribosomal protein L29 [Chromatiales bacterium]|nr:50S ribosomal protein L29 [Chromatiales bacterium]